MGSNKITYIVLPKIIKKLLNFTDLNMKYRKIPTPSEKSTKDLHSQVTSP